jgi:hypothetical protein
MTMKSILTFLALSAITLDAVAADPLPGTRRCPVPEHGRTIQASGSAIQAAINGATAPATIVVAPGTYTTGTIKLKSGVWLRGDGAVTLNSSTMVFDLTAGQKDVWVSGFTVNGGPPAKPCCQGTLVMNGGANDIHVVNNTFKNFNAGFWLWNVNNAYVQCNTFKDGIQAISSRSNGGSNDNQVISDNVITNMSRMGIETGHFGTSFTNFHVDRNDVSVPDLALSIIGYYDSGTVWGNTIHGSHWAIEVGNGGKQRTKLTVSQNVLTSDTWGIGPSHCPGTVIEDNTMTAVGAPFIKDGGYDGTEWIGVNTIGGKQVKGAFGKTYGVKPPTYQPSAVPGSLLAGPA